MLEFSQVSVRQTIYGLLIETTACSSSILLVTERMFAYKTEGIDAGDLTSCCPCCASLLWLEFLTFQGPRLIESAADRFLHFLLWPARFDLFGFRIPREIIHSHTSVGSRVRGIEVLIAFNSRGEYETRLRPATTTWRIGFTLIAYFTVRSIDTIITFLSIFIIFAYITRFSFLSGNH